jgi:hypothetical protein
MSAASDENQRYGMSAALWVSSSVASSRARRQLVPRCAAMLTPPSAGRAEQKSHLADERFHDPRTPQRTSASATIQRSDSDGAN